MKAKIQAGAEIDILSKNEVGDLLDDHVKNFDRMLSEGLKYGKLSSSLNSAINGGNTPTYSSGVFQLGGPEPGYVWSIKNITVVNLGTTGGDLLINGSNPSDIVHAGLVNTQTVYPGGNGVIIPSGGQAYLGMKNAQANSAIILYYLELPVRDIGKL